MPKLSLIRDPADWARDWGWVSRTRAVNMAHQLRRLAIEIEIGAFDDAASKEWCKELRKIAKTLAPAEVPARRKMREES